MQESMKKLSTVKGRMSRDFRVLTKNAEKGWMEMYNGLTRRACRDKIIFNAAQECTRKVASMNFYHLVGIQKLATRYTQLDASQLHNEDGRVSRKLKIINLFVNERQRRRRWGSWRRLTALLLLFYVRKNCWRRQSRRLIASLRHGVSHYSLHRTLSTLLWRTRERKIDEQLNNF